MSEALKEAREYRDPTCPICEGEGCQCPQGEETIEEGFASDAQRRAAFAQGYKAKGKKKKKEEVEEPIEIEEKFTSQQIKQAYGILNDPRYKQGNYSGAVAAINKLAPGLADHPDVKNALKRANEELQEASKYLRYSDLLVQKGRMQRAGDKQGERLTDIEIEKEKKKLGIKEGTMIGGIVTDSGRKMPGYDKAKKALKDFMSKPQPAKGADNKVMAFIFDDELLDDLYVASKKNVSDVRPIVKKRLKTLGIKGEFIPEGMVKRVMQTVHDKLSKEGGAAGFDDLAKEVKKEFGINISKDTLKKMPGVKQHRDGDFILEETEQLDEFTKADFAKLEADNEHGEAAKKLVQKFGTPEEKKEIDAINKRHKQTGYIKGPDYQRRYQITNKYYSRLR